MRCDLMCAVCAMVCVWCDKWCVRCGCLQVDVWCCVLADERRQADECCVALCARCEVMLRTVSVLYLYDIIFYHTLDVRQTSVCAVSYRYRSV